MVDTAFGWILLITASLALVWVISQAVANPANRALNIAISLLGIIGFGIGEYLKLREKFSRVLQTFILWMLGFRIKGFELKNKA
jgi:hypothetical protein